MAGVSARGVPFSRSMSAVVSAEWIAGCPGLGMTKWPAGVLNLRSDASCQSSDVLPGAYGDGYRTATLPVGTALTAADVK